MKRAAIISLALIGCLILFGAFANQTLAEELVEGEDYFTYEGAGDDFIEIEKPEEIAIMHIIGNQADSFFAVQGYDADGNSTELFVNTTDPYEGTVALDFDDEETTHLEIEADTGDEWNIGIFPIGATEYWVEVPGEITGENDSIVMIEGSPTMADIEGNQADSFFAITGWLEEDGWFVGSDLLVNTTDPYEGTVRMESETMILEIEAVGEWTIEVQ